MPFEFPTFQLMCAALAWLGIPLDLAGRAVTVAFFALSFVYMAKLLDKYCGQRALLPFCILCLGSPFAIIWSRNPLIDYCSVFLCAAAFFYLSSSFDQRQKHYKELILGFTLMALAIVTKVTSIIGFLVPILCIAFLKVWNYKNDKIHMYKIVLTCIFLVLISFISVTAWPSYSDYLKNQSLATKWLISTNMHGWNFGDIHQRLDLKNWNTIVQRISNEIIPFIIIILLFSLIINLKTKKEQNVLAIGLLSGILLQVAIFFNLFVVHDYYLISVTFSIWALASIGISKILGIRANYQACGCLILLLLILFSGWQNPIINANFSMLQNNQLVKECKQAQTYIAEDSQIFIFGEDWNSRIPYYIERKCIMHGKLNNEFVRNYANHHKVKFIIARRDALPDLKCCFPGAVQIMCGKALSLWKIES